MKNKIIALCGAALVSLCALPLVHAQSASFNVLYNFTNGSGGARPGGALVQSGNTLYGTAQDGGVSPNGDRAAGTVFMVNTDGSCFTALFAFSLSDGGGLTPDTGLILSGTSLYGTTPIGGNSYGGTVYAIRTDGTDYTNLHNFTTLSGSSRDETNSDGNYPNAGLVLSGNTLYGTANEGGTGSFGCVFAVNTDGSGFTNLYNFTSGSDGANPYGGLIVAGNTLFGTTIAGGDSDDGTVFKVNTDGTGFTVLHEFTAASATSSTNSDGAAPLATLILSGNTLYGTAEGGGISGDGTVFKVNTNGGCFATLHSFTSAIDGEHPTGGMVLSGHTLYGTTGTGGPAGAGTVFEVNTDGTLFATLHNFGPAQTPNVVAALMLSGNILYGTTVYGGSSNEGTVFALTLFGPPLGITTAGDQVVVSWPAAATNYTLQTASDLSSGNWSSITNGIATSGINFVLTNAVAAQSAYFRLQQQ